MLDHHKESIVRLMAYFKEDPTVIALILGGSVSRNEARPDSDIDAEVIVTPMRFQNLKEQNKLTEVIFGHCTYEGGYFDIKYCTKDFLCATATNGSEPARNAFRGARCLFTHDEEIPALVERIPIFQQQEKSEKMFSFYSAMAMSQGYFWNMSQQEVYLRTRAASDIVLYGLRMLLQENEVLFPCHKGLLAAVEKLTHKPAGIIEKARELLRDPVDCHKEAFVDALMQFLQYQPPHDYAEVLTRYVDDNEQWWYKSRPVIAEW